MFDLNMSIFDEYGEEIDDLRLEEYMEGLMAEFTESPEAEAFLKEFESSAQWPAVYMHYAATYFGETPATIGSGETNEIVFDIFPRKVSVEAKFANEIISELRAFWQFLARTRSVANAESILEFLTDDNAEDLEEALADSSNFGMAKSLFSSGTEAGFDMADQEDMLRFAMAYNASLGGNLPELAEMPELEETEVDDYDIAPPMLDSPSTIRNEVRRVGRNDPCPCNSGRKYKKCCDK